MFRKLLAGTLLASLALATIAPVASAQPETRGQIASSSDGVTRLINFNNQNRGQLSTLIAAATCSQLGSAVTDVIANGKITLFAPRNSAFRDLGRALGVGGNRGITAANVCAVDSILGAGTLANILTYHVTPGKIWYWQALAARGNALTMANSERAFLKGKARNVRVDGGKVTIANVRSANAIMHVIDRVMIPPSVEKVLAS